MAFETYEESRESGSKIQLFTLTIGTTIYRMHTSVEVSIAYSGDTYYRTQVKLGESIKTGQEYIEVILPGSHEFPLQYASIAPGQTATLTIQEYHRADPTDVRVIYKGVVRAVAFRQNALEAALSLVPVNEVFDKPIPERTYQAMCNNVLFDSKCQVSAGSFEYVGTVSAVTDNVVTVTGLQTAKGNGWSTGGYVRIGVLDYRLILEQDGDDLVLVLPFYESVLNESVNVFAGCDHTIGTCDTKFSNEINFGGCPYVPTKNIFLMGLK